MIGAFLFLWGWTGVRAVGWLWILERVQTQGDEKGFAESEVGASSDREKVNGRC